MDSIIKSLTVVCNQGVNTYTVGKKCNGLLLDEIIDGSIEYSEGTEFVYQGKTKEGVLVFEVINAPVDITYMAVKE